MSPADTILTAAKNGAIDQVVRLLDADKSLATAANMTGSQPIHAAYFAGHHRIVELLLGRGVRLDGFLAAELGMIDRVREDMDADPQFTAAYSAAGSTALHRCCYWGQIAVARLLLDHGADVNAVTRDSFLQIRPLGCAVATPDVPNPSDREEVVVELVALLLDRGAEVNGRRRDGLTALHSAAYRGHTEVLKLLLERGANCELKGYDGPGPHAAQTPADLARAQGQRAAVDLLQ